MARKRLTSEPSRFHDNYQFYGSFFWNILKRHKKHNTSSTQLKEPERPSPLTVAQIHTIGTITCGNRYSIRHVCFAGPARAWLELCPVCFGDRTMPEGKTKTIGPV